MDTRQLDQAFIANTYARFPLTLTHGHGSTVYDDTGKSYIDLGTGIAVNAFGVGDSEWKAAVTAQLDLIPHSSNLYYTEPQVRLARHLCERTGMARVFFGNSGAEANECLIKAARKWNSDQFGEEKRSTLVTLEGSFHGRTLTTLSATGQDVFHRHFGPFTPGFAFARPNDLDQMKQLLSERDDVGCVLMEMVLGEGGVVPLTQEYVQGVAALCREKNILIAVDEVQTGNGRTGTLYAYEQYGITPDIVSTAKGIGGGLPIGACLLGERLKDTLGPGSHGSTFGGNPVSAAGALSILTRIDQSVLDGVKAKHALIVDALKGAKGVQSVTGLGLMLGIECERPAKDVVADCMQRGMLVLTAKNKVRLLPALNIPDEQLKAALAILKEVFAQ